MVTHGGSEPEPLEPEYYTIYNIITKNMERFMTNESIFK